MNKLKIGISIGDINGIGLEVILKTLNNSAVLDFCTPVLYGSSKVVSYHKNIVGIDFHFQLVKDADRLQSDKINVINCWQEDVNITMGKATEQSGQCAIKSLDAAVTDLKNGLIDALVTAPINKEAMNMAGFPFPGHTEFLTERMGSGKSLMFMINEELRIGLVTNHLPLRTVPDAITKEKVIDKIRTMNESLKIDFGIERPIIAVLGLNPHSSDNGVFGDEEEKIIRPAVVESKKNGIMVVGPLPGDGLFGSGKYRKFDGILAMYHDQGLIPFKALSFGKGVNFTAGLSGVRTSPDHGTAYDMAGNNEADPSSFRQALYAAIDISRSRLEYMTLKENALVKKEKMADTGEDEAISLEEET